MAVQIKLRKGGDIKLQGTAEKTILDAPESEFFAIKPGDFHGVTPKLVLKVGAKVKAGTPVFFDKENEKIKFSSPVSGEIAEIVRGARRVILEIKIKADGTNASEEATVNSSDSKVQIIEKMLNVGLWPMVKQRPFNSIANPTDAPKAVFVSAFDSSPLAPDYDFLLKGREDDFQAGIDAFSKLSGTGKVNLNVSSNNASGWLSKVNNAEVAEIDGQHPAGNVGIQIHHLNPMNKGEVVWTVNAQDVAIIGNFLRTGKVSAKKVIALTGSEVTAPKYYNVTTGQSLAGIFDGNIETAEETPRFISGNVLTGAKVEKEGYLGFYDSQLTVIPEGDQYDFFGWAVPVQPKKHSFSHTLWSWITPNKEYRLNTNLNGEGRAFVVSGQYEELLPMNVLPVHLLKACLVEDIDMMEGLGIYEIVPEDLALCEFACTSKQPAQEILQAGLDLVKKECA
ncbi:MAG: Na+-transporting NADH:ubiquinone oxidoreductase subunit A [Saprospiraceae bacterium]|jgi:Na+-transporting NADH:ubiquinone oxidoreductase subunit A